MSEYRYKLEVIWSVKENSAYFSICQYTKSLGPSYDYRPMAGRKFPPPRYVQHMKWASFDLTFRTDLNDIPCQQEWQKRNVSESDSNAKFILHRERQRNFYPACFRNLQQANRTWTMVIDVDEFAIQNSHFINGTADILQTTLLNAIQESPQHNKAPCITMPRVRYGNFEDINTTGKNIYSPSGFNDEDFLTLRWRWRAALHSRKV